MVPTRPSPSTCRAAASRAAQALSRQRQRQPHTPGPAAAAAAAAFVTQPRRSLNTSSRPVAAAPAPQRRSRFLQTSPTTTGPRLQKINSSSITTIHNPRRAYHSYDHPSPPSPFSPIERTILTAAYAHVPEHGFSQKALALGARDAGYLDISTNVLPDGVYSLVQWHLVSQREALAARAEVLFGGDEGQRLGVGRKVELLTWERLLGNTPVIGQLQEALAIMAQPSYVPGSLKELAKLSDEIWFLVGDTSVDPSWYTKRASLSATYASAELFMTSDRSDGFVETRKFLHRRLEEVHDVGGTLRSVGQWVGFTASAGLNVLRSKGVRI
ncbi:Ubiquinone biosynthesis protein coq9, mitochondrial [Cytospora paraplurivora]|uniref:Ubiquinone biosynthesis protein n=1 Tax=Cytospora paraplurivora TaxID=2898453 RepID=A0AAN9YK94_9PEZI